MKSIPLVTCSMFGEPCWYCSEETTSRPYTHLIKAPSGLFKPDGIGRKYIGLGAYCNNACDWVEKLHYCPRRWEETKEGKKYKLTSFRYTKNQIKEYCKLLKIHPRNLRVEHVKEMLCPYSHISIIELALEELQEEGGYYGKQSTR